MRRFWLFPGLAVLATGCPSDDTSATAEDTGTDNGDDDNDDDNGPTSADDDGSTSSNPDSSGGETVGTTMATGESGTTMASPICGDGNVDDGEECDDENMDNGDACSAECTIPFEVLWTMTHNGSASNQDDANDVVIDAAGNIYVAGDERNTGTGRDAWVQQYMADGTEGWTFVFDGADSLDDGANAIAFDADGNLVVVGATESAATVEDILLLQVNAADGTAIGEPVIIDGPGSGPGEFDDLDGASAVALDPSGAFIVGGAVRVDLESYNAWVAEIDPAAMPSPVVWEQTLNGPGSGPDRTRAVSVAADGTVTAVANQELADNSTVGIVLVYGDDGTPDDTATTELDLFVNDAEIDADGNLVIVGSDETGNSLADIRTSLYDGAFAEQWTQRHDGPAHANDFGGAVAVDVAGNVVSVGSDRPVGRAGGNAWIGTYAVADGALGWSDVYGGAAELDDFYSGVAVTPEGDYVVVGSESVIGQQRNSFVRKYRPL